MNAPSIPEGMVPWHGGDSAPPDWDGGPVLLGNGRIWDWRVDGQGQELIWTHRGGMWWHGDIIAYTPRTPAEPVPAVSGAEAMREAAARVADQAVTAFEGLRERHGDMSDRESYHAGQANGAMQVARGIRALPLPADTSSGWQPIETAPRDGTWFLACATAKGWGATRIVRFAHSRDRLPIHGEGNIWPSEPTHWMPLPPAPLAAAEESGQ